eukprot:10464104-Ditylum_brightwellii.AAC.1
MMPSLMVNNFIQPAQPTNDGGTPHTHCHGGISMPDPNRTACIQCSAQASGAGVSRTLNFAPPPPLKKDSTEEIDELQHQASLD